MAGTYGLGGGLAGYGQAQQAEATQMLGQAAASENQRNIENEQLESQRKQGNQQLGATLGTLGGMALGAQYGSAAGPWGAVIGGLVGAVAGNLF